MTASNSGGSGSTKPVGVLAFGSLIWDPQEELDRKTERSIKTLAPWPVEYARRSTTRCGAPTLVKVCDGERVSALIWVLDECNICDARRLVARREGCSPSLIATCEELTEQHEDLQAVLYTALDANIDPPPTGEELADLAICSCRKLAEKGEPEKNGIRYLRETICVGVKTALTDEYKEAILQRCQASDLYEAENKCLEGKCR